MSPCIQRKSPTEHKTPGVLIVQLIEGLCIISPQAGILVRYHHILDRETKLALGSHLQSYLENL